MGCKIYKDTLRYHIFTASHWVEKCPESIISSNIALLQLWDISQGMDERENGKQQENSPDQCGAAVTPYIESLTSQCQRKKKSLKKANRDPRVLPGSENISTVLLQLKCHCQSSDSSEQPLEESVSVPPRVCGRSPETTAWVGAQLRSRYQTPPPRASPDLCVTTL